jgi:hypothetical protein
MEPMNVQLCVIAKCRNCGRTYERALPLKSGSEIACVCGHTLYVSSGVINEIAVLQADFLARVCGS